MTTQVPTTLTRDEIDALLVQATGRCWWHSALRAALHEGLTTLANNTHEEGYLLRPVDGLVEAMGPMPRALWLDAEDRTPTAFDIADLEARGFTWQPCTNPAALDLNAVGIWYMLKKDGSGTQYVQHTQGFFDALDAYLESPDSDDPQGEERRPLGRVRAVVVYPDGHYELSNDASSLPIVLTLKEGDDGDDLRADLSDIVGYRGWP